MSDNGCNGEKISAPGEDFARVSEYEPGSNNCLNRSLSASCSRVGAAGCGGRPSDLNQPALGFPLCSTNGSLARMLLKNRSKICGASGNPMRAGLKGLPFVNPPWFREKSQPHEELSLSYLLVATARDCRCRSKKRSTMVRLSAASCSGVRRVFRGVSTPRISSGVISAQFSRASCILCSRCASARESVGARAGAGNGSAGL